MVFGSGSVGSSDSGYTTYQKFCRLNSHWICDNNVWVWNWDWHLPLRGRSLDDLNDLISSLNLPPLVVDSIDSWKHVLSPKGVFTVNYLSRSIDKPLAATSPNAQIMQWNPWLPKMVNIFIWRVVLDRLPHLENLIARDVTVDSDLCHLEPKNRDHLFFNCQRSVIVWRKKFSWWSIPFPGNRLNHVLPLMSSSSIPGLCKTGTKVFRGVCSVALGLIWKWRNTAYLSSPESRDVIVISDPFAQI
ncbi:RNA-directed DNA polymerase, eukaryota, reverse transcriptase zinc-binding domain protein [Tanacetum coccineum]